MLNNLKKLKSSAQKGMKLDSAEEWINTNLALALLYQRKLEAAKVIYLRLKDKPYGNATYAKAFNEDLDALEMERITHLDVDRIRELLK